MTNENLSAYHTHQMLAKIANPNNDFLFHQETIDHKENNYLFGRPKKTKNKLWLVLCSNEKKVPIKVTCALNPKKKNVYPTLTHPLLKNFHKHSVIGSNYLHFEFVSELISKDL